MDWKVFREMLALPFITFGGVTVIGRLLKSQTLSEAAAWFLFIAFTVGMAVVAGLLNLRWAKWERDLTEGGE